MNSSPEFDTQNTAKASQVLISIAAWTALYVLMMFAMAQLFSH
jgi:hypothetical protein